MGAQPPRNILSPLHNSGRNAISRHLQDLGDLYKNYTPTARSRSSSLAAGTGMEANSCPITWLQWGQTHSVSRPQNWRIARSDGMVRLHVGQDQYDLRLAEAPCSFVWKLCVAMMYSCLLCSDKCSLIVYIARNMPKLPDSR